MTQTREVRNDGTWPPIMAWLDSLKPAGHLAIPFGSAPVVTRNQDGTLNVARSDGEGYDIAAVGDYLTVEGDRIVVRREGPHASSHQVGLPEAARVRGATGLRGVMVRPADGEVCDPIEISHVVLTAALDLDGSRTGTPAVERMALGMRRYSDYGNPTERDHELAEVALDALLDTNAQGEERYD